MIAGIAVLCSLGTWQLKRLAWKEALVAQIAERTAATPKPLEEILEIAENNNDLEYWSVEVQGTYDHENEVYFYTVREGLSGWDIYTPLVLKNGERLVVNRGIVPYQSRDPVSRSAGQVDGVQTVSGYVRSAPEEKPNYFVPDNKPERREFYWRDLDAMTSLMGRNSGGQFLTFFLEADNSPNPGGWPRGGGSLIKLPNSHFQYALTWFGLALTLLGVGSYFLYSRRNPS